MQVNVKKEIAAVLPVVFLSLSLPPFSLSKNFHLNENPASVFCCARGGGVQLVRIGFKADQCEHTSCLLPRPLRLLAWRVIGWLGGARLSIKACPVCYTSVFEESLPVSW